MSVPEAGLAAPVTDSAIPHGLDIADLSVAYRVRGGRRTVLHGLNLRIPAGGSYGLVGESGCGKSTVALTAVRYLPTNGEVTAGAVRIGGRDITTVRGEELRKLRAGSVAMVYQSPGRALNPTIRVGDQIAESYVVNGTGWDEARERAVEMLRAVQIADPDLVMRRYPHELSGGMQQRVVIGMALAKNPELLILDEPTTGLDATVEAEVLDLIEGLRERFRTTVLFISHNLHVVARMCDEVGVLYAGRLVEEGPSEIVLNEPRHPYTASLLGCIPRAGMHKRSTRLASIPGTLPAPGIDPAGCVFAERCPVAEERCFAEVPVPRPAGSHTVSCHFPERTGAIAAGEPLDEGADERISDERAILEVRELRKSFGSGPTAVQVLTGISLELREGETLGIVGESGSGKSTLARTILGLTEPDEGRIELDGRELAPSLKGRTREDIRGIQIVFQNPDSAINHQHRLRRVVARPLRQLGSYSAADIDRRVRELFEEVRLPPDYAETRPASLSGGMKQRVAIARAFAGKPRIVVCDEPTSALDVSVQAAILNLLVRLQAEERAAYIFISHDLAVVRYIADRIMVMYLGRVMEVGPAADVFEPPHHPYTEALLSTARSGVSGKPRIKLEGEPPSVANQPSGCVFHTRCPRRIDGVCNVEAPPRQRLSGGREIHCHIPAERLRELQKRAPRSASGDTPGGDDT